MRNSALHQDLRCAILGATAGIVLYMNVTVFSMLTLTHERAEIQTSAQSKTTNLTVSLAILFHMAQYLGVVSAAQVLVLPGGNKMVMRAWQAAVSEVLESLEAEASECNADAVIAVTRTTHGSNICAVGAAVKLNPM